MDLEVSRFAVVSRQRESTTQTCGSTTYYAGKRRTLNAVATTAHCAIEGYISDMEAYPERRRRVQWLAVKVWGYLRVREYRAIKS